MKLGRQEAVVLMIFGLVLGLAIYFFFSPANTPAPAASDEPELQAVIESITQYNTDTGQYRKVHAYLAAYGNTMISDNRIQERELENYETYLGEYSDVCRVLKTDIHDSVRLVKQNYVYFENSSRVVSEFNDMEMYVDEEMSAVIGFLDGITEVTPIAEHKEILSNLSAGLVEIRDSN